MVLYRAFVGRRKSHIEVAAFQSQNTESNFHTPFLPDIFFSPNVLLPQLHCFQVFKQLVK